MLKSKESFPYKEINWTNDHPPPPKKRKEKDQLNNIVLINLLKYSTKN